MLPSGVMTCTTAGWANCLLRLVVAVLEAHRVGELADVVLGAGEEVPGGRLRLAHGLQVAPAALEALRGRVLGIDAHRDGLVVLAQLQPQLAHGGHLAVDDEVTEHGALVIHQRQQRGLVLGQHVAQADFLARLVREAGIQRQRLAQVLLHVHAAHLRRLVRVDDVLRRLAATRQGKRRQPGAQHERGHGKPQAPGGARGRQGGEGDIDIAGDLVLRGGGSRGGRSGSLAGAAALSAAGAFSGALP